VIVAASTAWIDAIILVSIIVPIGGFCIFAAWFLRAGRAQEERERAARGRPPT
jgi:hypothetical protein